LTPTGDKLIEEFKVGDWILTRPEQDPEGELEAKQVEELIRARAWLWELRVGGKQIKTTDEHPFYVRGSGWTAAKDLLPGDELLSHDGRLLAVESVEQLRELAPVYNLRIADYHTYFVGSRQWEFSVWAHNANGACYWNVFERHHLLPQEFGKFFKAKGFDIGKYVIDLPRWQHRLKPWGLHTGPNSWNAMWDAWIAANPRATPEMILQELARLRMLFGI
jgi:intein/homing endonuclease